MPDLKSSAHSHRSNLAGVVILLTAISAAAVWWCASHGYTLYYGDAEAHLNIARRVLDSRTPGPEQLGTAWLPLPHVLMLSISTCGKGSQTVPSCSGPGVRESSTRRAMFRCASASP